MTSAAGLGDFFRELKGACVLKPLSGSGSEFVFRCDTEQEGERRFKEIQTALQRRRTNRLYQQFVDDEPAVLAEEYVSGSEYSCDFIIEKERVEIVRLTSKIFSPRTPFGIVLGYFLPTVLPPEIDEHDLYSTLYRCAMA